jgi:hypothetical protein
MSVEILVGGTTRAAVLLIQLRPTAGPLAWSLRVREISTFHRGGGGGGCAALARHSCIHC